MDNNPDYQIKVNIYTMKHLKRFESYEDTPGNVVNIKAVLEDFCEKYDFELKTNYNCFEIFYRSGANSVTISTKMFKNDLIIFFKKISAHHKQEEVDRFDIDIKCNDAGYFNFTNLFNIDRAKELYTQLENVESFTLLKLSLSIRFTYRYY